MKELSIEEKANAYDKMREKIALRFGSNVAEGIFSEFEISEDEKIRKAIINIFATHKDYEVYFGVSVKDIRVWLEKQGEQKTTNKVEPKFKVGDWITDGYLHHKITDVLEDRYIVETKYIKRSAILFEHESRYHLWTIADAKDGDVLVNGYNIFIFHFINDTRLMGYCHVNTDKGRFYDDIGKYECFCLIDAVVNPATKEQCELLFQKMKEAGYMWDGEKKELKRIEQKPKWGEEDEKNWCGIIDEIKANKSTAPDYDIETYDRFLCWLDNIKQRMEGKL